MIVLPLVLVSENIIAVALVVNAELAKALAC
jgi:hypothetical protein